MLVYIKIAFLSIILSLGFGCKTVKPVIQEDLTSEDKELPDLTEEIYEKKIQDNFTSGLEQQSIIPIVEEEVLDSTKEEIEETWLKPKNTQIIEQIEDLKSDASTFKENNKTKIIKDQNNTITPKIELKEEKEEIVFIPHTKQIGVLKIKILEDGLRVMIKDPIIKHFYLDNPHRIVIDFKDIRYFESKNEKINSPKVYAIATAAHENYNRAVFYLKEKTKYTISKNRGDWLIKLK